MENEKLKSIKPFPKLKPRPCIFEYIYFARPDSIINGKCAYEYRKNLGVELAKESDLKADLLYLFLTLEFQLHLVLQKILIKFELGLIRNHYVGRTFIEPAQNIRSLRCKIKIKSNKKYSKK